LTQSDNTDSQTAIIANVFDVEQPAPDDFKMDSQKTGCQYETLGRWKVQAQKRPIATLCRKPTIVSGN